MKQIHCRYCKRDVERSDALAGRNQHTFAKVPEGKIDRIVLICLVGYSRSRNWQ